MKILSVSDIELGLIYSAHIAERFGDVDLVISCGDLPYYYLEFMISMLDKPLYFVRGNHASKLEIGVGGVRTAPWGAINLHNRVLRTESGLLLAGIEGSVRYNRGPYQYTQGEMWWMVLRMVPALLWNKLRYGRYL
ncbi:MAG TPA: metallophosphoesterase, partial [Anaerolineaceae bacterium]|nr:metallophosphoesterase [Anaerolineaceae bacterium]